MAKKKTTKEDKLIMTQTFIEAVRADMEKPATSEGGVTRAVRLDLSPDVHHRLRIAAAFLNTNMSALARKVVEEWLTQYEVEVRGKK